MDYQETLSYLYESLPMYQRIGASAYKADLKNAWELDHYFGKLHRQYKTIHVAGTNGKGSVCHMLAAILQSAGYSVGLYTSPHILDFRERIKINGEEVPEEYISQFVAEHKSKFEALTPSFFEMTVFMAFSWFAHKKVDFAIIEVGLGGRLDTTNVIVPEVSVITNIGKDHTQFLGNTLAEIAREKAGIMKEKVPVVVGQKQSEIEEIFRSKAEYLESPICFADQEYAFEYALQTLDNLSSLHYKKHSPGEKRIISLDLPGMYQKHNAATALTVVDVLRQKGIILHDQAVDEGMANTIKLTGLMGRWQITGYNPIEICDIAHNKEGIREILGQLNNMACEIKHLILGFVDDKDLEGIIELLPKDARYYLCEPKIPRALKLADLEALFTKHEFQYSAFHKLEEAYQNAQMAASENDLILISGSTFLVSDFLSLKKNVILFEFDKRQLYLHRF